MTTKVTVIPPEEPRFLIEIDRKTALALLNVLHHIGGPLGDTPRGVLAVLYDALSARLSIVEAEAIPHDASRASRNTIYFTESWK
jgi:hypothetical protein